MKIHEIREMKTEEILERVAEEERNLVDLKFAHQLKQLTNTAKLQIVRRDIAKMKSVLTERERAEKSPSAGEIKEGVNA
ncbi:MAG: 50S ribosomal protein L29 [Ignavibacteriaceae bacterium]|nr:50S ribosomal protein L29 [Ignavibacteriaceae bacterium]